MEGKLWGDSGLKLITIQTDAIYEQLIDETLTR